MFYFQPAATRCFGLNRKPDPEFKTWQRSKTAMKAENFVRNIFVFCRLVGFRQTSDRPTSTSSAFIAAARKKERISNVGTSVTQLGDLKKFCETIFLTESSPNIWHLFGLVRKCHWFSKNGWNSFWATFYSIIWSHWLPLWHDIASVIRFGKISPLWQKITSLSILKGSFSIWLNVNPTFAKTSSSWTNYHCCILCQRLKNNWVIWSHWTKLRRS